MILPVTLRGYDRLAIYEEDDRSILPEPEVQLEFVDGGPDINPLHPHERESVRDQAARYVAAALDRVHPDALLAVQALAVTAMLGAGIWGGWL